MPTKITRFTRPRWAPDSRSIYVVGSDGKNTLAIFRVQVRFGPDDVSPSIASRGPISSSSPRPGTASPSSTHISNSPRSVPGSWASTWPRASPAASCTGRTPRRTSPGLSASPDGKELIFGTLAPGDSYVLMAIPLPGGPPRQIIKAKSSAFGTSLNIYGGCWTPDGKHILSFRDVGQGRERKSELCFLPAAGGEIQGARPRWVEEVARAISAFIPTDGAWPIRSAVRPPRSGSWRISCPRKRNSRVVTIGRR